MRAACSATIINAWATQHESRDRKVLLAEHDLDGNTRRNTHQSHELRFSTPDDKRIRGLVGVYWEDYKIVDQTQWRYVTVPTCSPTGLNVDCLAAHRSRGRDRLRTRRILRPDSSTTWSAATSSWRSSRPSIST